MSKLSTTLLKKKVSSDIADNIGTCIKELFKNLDLAEIKKDKGVILYIMQEIEKAILKNKDLKSSSKSELDKSDILLQVIKKLFPSVTQSELDEISYTISFIVDNNLLGAVTKKSFFSQILKLVFGGK